MHANPSKMEETQRIAERELVEFRFGDHLVKSDTRVECYSVLPNDQQCSKPGYVYEHCRDGEVLREMPLCDDCRTCITEQPV